MDFRDGLLPSTETIVKLLRSRWEIPSSDKLDMILDESLFAATVIISSGTEVFHLHIAVEDLSSYNSAEETLSGLLDALDCLVGQLETNGRAHRELPIGSGVIYGDKSYTVDIQKSIAKLERLADTWLKPR